MKILKTNTRQIACKMLKICSEYKPESEYKTGQESMLVG